MKYLAILPIVALLAACTYEMMSEADEGPGGAALYDSYCAGCHGAGAKGGDVVGGKRVPDLTTLSARHGGDFPAAYVMSTIDGYARDDTHGPMPEFGALLGGETEIWEDADGIPTPTPATLVRLSEYLESVQG